LIHIQREQVQMQHDNSFADYYPMPCYDHAMFGHEEVHTLQQPHAVAPEHNGEFVETEYGQMPSPLAHINVDEWIGCQEIFAANVFLAFRTANDRPCRVRISGVRPSFNP
jgi:hypothetical protein